jgi:uncharacterized protein (DUF2235 family)
MKRIVICADGTWNVRDQVPDMGKTRHPTNVTKVARAVLPRDAHGVDQVVFYHEGVGTSGGLDKYTGGAFGQGIENNIRELYRFIVYNYEPNDELYFFGFSRGAFTVRTLAGFMNLVGLVQKDDDYYVPELYSCYENNETPGTPRWQKAYHNIKDALPCPPIRFIGVWDTVGALGAPGFLGQLFNKKKYQYHDIGLHAAIQNAFQALALDERRKPFRPDVWVRPAGWTGRLQQAWFAGVHSNVGGGYAPDGLANEALHWMVERAEQLGLEFDSAYLKHYTPCFNSVLRDSMSTAYKLMGAVLRPIDADAARGEVIHQSAFDRMALAECRYTPKNLADYRATVPAPEVVNTARIARGTPCPAMS